MIQCLISQFNESSITDSDEIFLSSNNVRWRQLINSQFSKVEPWWKLRVDFECYYDFLDQFKVILFIPRSYWTLGKERLFICAISSNQKKRSWKIRTWTVIMVSWVNNATHFSTLYFLCGIFQHSSILWHQWDSKSTRWNWKFAKLQQLLSLIDVLIWSST